jgi:hypothetical protein
MLNTPRFLSIRPKPDDRLMFMNPEAEHLSFEARLERRRVSAFVVYKRRQIFSY